jgi:hypothetical protein
MNALRRFPPICLKGRALCFGRGLTSLKYLTHSTFHLHFRPLSAVAGSHIAELLAAKGIPLDIVEARFPGVQQCDASNAGAILFTLESAGVKVCRAVTRHPHLLNRDPISLKERIELLDSFGINIPKTTTHNPWLLTYRKQTVKEKFAFLHSRGLDPGTVVNGFPQVLGLRESHVCETLDFLQQAGLDPIRIVHSHPRVLGSTLQNKLRPIIIFITVEMGRPVEQLNRYPQCFNYSLTRRLRPRYQYALAHHGRTLSLATLFRTTDAQFAWAVARCPAEHYLSWGASPTQVASDGS